MKSRDGTDAVVRGWIEGVEGFLADNALSWSQVTGVGLALPGPYRSYGVLERSANLPAPFAGWNFHADYSAPLTARAGRAIPLVVGNDGDLGGVGEAARVRGKQRSSVVMLAPGSGLATAYIDSRGLPLSGEHLAGMEAGHMPTPLHLLGAGLDKVAPFSCGCGRTWGCVEACTALSGLPQYIAHLLPKHADHPLATSPDTPRQQALSLRGLAQKGDPLALEICDMQAKALGIHAANLAMALDPGFVVIGGGALSVPCAAHVYENFRRLLGRIFPGDRSRARRARHSQGAPRIATETLAQPLKCSRPPAPPSSSHCACAPIRAGASPARR